jgi:hypothetical protein
VLKMRDWIDLHGRMPVGPAEVPPKIRSSVALIEFLHLNDFNQ